MSELRRTELHGELTRAGRTLGKAAARLNAACAERLGLHPTEWECIVLLMDVGPGTLTAGQLADQSGLTSGAVTGLIDRLETKGWVHRERDPQDRRRVIVRLLRDPARRVNHMLAGMQADMGALLDGYSDDQLEATASLMLKASEVLRAYALAMRSGGD